MEITDKLPTVVNKDLVCNGVEDVIPIAKKLLPFLQHQDLSLREVSGGTSNKLYRITTKSPKKHYLLRIYGKGSENLIDRDHELWLLEKLEPSGLGPKVYGIFQNGIIYEFFVGETLTPQDLRAKTYNKDIASHMGKWHRAYNPEKEITEPLLWKYINSWLSQVPKQYSVAEYQKEFEDLNFEKIRGEAEVLKKILDKAQSPIVLCHNDVQSGNIIANEGRVHFIDMEYSGFSQRGFDIANHFCEYGGLQLEFAHFPSKETQLEFCTAYLASYLSRKPTDAEVELLMDEVNRFVLASHYMWGIWALVQAANSEIEFDYIGYGRKRFEAYFAHKETIPYD